MLFQNVSFLIFFALVWVLYWKVPRARLWVLAIGNALFYMGAGWENLVLFGVASAATYALGGFVTGRHGRWVLGIGIALNVLNLAFFKYTGFVLSSLHEALPSFWAVPPELKALLLPIGISFYTFQHISYLVDRRTRGLEPAPNYLHFWVYIAFFGHSIAGPIMRGHEFLPQIAETLRLRFDAAQCRYGAALFTMGLLKKVWIADALAVRVDPLFARAGALTFGEAWAAALLFAFQIYFDFSAYSDMAVGIGHMFGYRLTLNFRTPYLAGGPSEFWTRWHITLSQWIRDYIYIPLGGSRCGPVRRDVNLMAAMLVSGLWHGAAWTFLYWGAYHGALLLAERHWRNLKQALGWRWLDGRVYRLVATGGFFLLVTLGWVLFRAPGPQEAMAMFAAMARVQDIATVGAVRSSLILAAGLYALHALEFALRERELSIGAWWVDRVPVVVQGSVYAAIAAGLMIAGGGANDFIYFRF